MNFRVLNLHTLYLQDSKCAGIIRYTFKGTPFWAWSWKWGWETIYNIDMPPYTIPNNAYLPNDTLQIYPGDTFLYQELEGGSSKSL